MLQEDRRKFLIDYLLQEKGQKGRVLTDEIEEKRLLRSLMNIRMPKETAEEFLAAQDKYLQEVAAEKGIVNIESLSFKGDIALWQGDITRLQVDAIVNAANSRMLGCFAPCHACIDNTIHTYAGVQLRQECYEIMEKQGHEEETGRAKITKGYNLPCRYVLHTVGPIVYGNVTEKERSLLASCYLSCLQLADEREVKSIAFCCISTGEFHFPNEEAATIALRTVLRYKEETGSRIKVIFNVFKDVDHEIYSELLQKNNML